MAQSTAGPPMRLGQPIPYPGVSGMPPGAQQAVLQAVQGQLPPGMAVQPGPGFGGAQPRRIAARLVYGVDLGQDIRVTPSEGPEKRYDPLTGEPLEITVKRAACVWKRPDGTETLFWEGELAGGCGAKNWQQRAHEALRELLAAELGMEPTGLAAVLFESRQSWHRPLLGVPATLADGQAATETHAPVLLAAGELGNWNCWPAKALGYPPERVRLWLHVG